MKNVLGWLLISSLSLSLCACGKSSNQQNVVAPNESLQTSVTTDSQTPEELITNAMKVYGWFKMVPLEVDYSNKRKADGKIWFKIKDDDFNTREKLDSYLKAIFADNIVDELWAENIYKEFNGYLYSFDGGRGRDIFIEDVKYDTKEIIENKVVYTATVTYSKDSCEFESSKIFEFVREKIGKKFVFTQFPFFW